MSTTVIRISKYTHRHTRAPTHTQTHACVFVLGNEIMSFSITPTVALRQRGPAALSNNYTSDQYISVDNNFLALSFPLQSPNVIGNN